MKAKQITTCLLQGSKNIDRMREETHQLISMIIGFALSSVNSKIELDEAFESENCVWRIKGYIKPDGFSHISVTCHVLIKGSTTSWCLAYIHNSDERNLRQSDDIQAVYEGIPVFVEGMISKFPNITKEWQFLIDASEVRFH